jgi:integrase
VTEPPWVFMVDASGRRRFHDLRHATATFLLAQGMGLEDVKNQLGHSSTTLTSNTYGHVPEQRQVARAMDAVLRR